VNTDNTNPTTETREIDMLKNIVLLSTMFIAAVSLNAASADEWIDQPLADGTYSESKLSYQTSTLELVIAASSDEEFNIHVQQGDTIVYAWTSNIAEPSLLLTEFHGHIKPSNGQPGKVMFYKVHKQGKGSGRMTAAFTGTHGWHLKNDSEKDIVIKLNLAGFYKEE